MYPAKIEVTKGKVFSRLTAVKQVVDDKYGAKRWLCRCACGNMKIIHANSLRQNLSTSCGCHRRATTIARSTKHGGCGTPEYKVWKNMNRRCYSEKSRGFSNYGGRGITVCAEWRHSFATFLKDMGRRPNSRAEIDRMNNDLGYFKNNCQWTTKTRNVRNRRLTKKVKYRGRLISLAECAELCGVCYNTLRARLLKYGWTVAKATTTPITPIGKYDRNAHRRKGKA